MGAEAHIRKTIRHGMEVSKDCFLHLHLKDIETVQGEPERLSKWVRIVRETAENL